ncbi:MAG TPA: type III polyketide synthase [Chryseolinea sp.]|nr:type III polyketide synthase [Chryseolinea sp.]HPH45568.1 type III polyketide synthase [Chryseolinea sp.]HPM29000.1 type III polyketide synthase [Chryseolinea sp.]
MSFITAIGTANPSHQFSQEALADFMVRSMQLSHDDERKLRTIFRATGIDNRYSVLSDYGKSKDFEFYPNTPDFEPFPSTQKRLEAFRDHALPLSLAAIENMKLNASIDLQKITHLIVVSCTGMYAPGLDIDIIKSLQLPTTTQRTCITFMGCYAAFNALKVADAYCTSDANSKVLIVCTELCSLHFQKTPTENNLLANALFADGSAAVLVEANSDQPVTLSLEEFHNDLAPEGEHDMAWSVGDLGFEMKLSAYVPSIIQSGIQQLTNSLLKKIAKEIQDIKHIAIHPGGKKIVEVIEHQMNLSKDQNKHALEVLKQYGNMSSPTVLFVLNEIFKTLSKADDGERILSLAFGPGLTLESMVLKIHSANA